jgi:hypothetical protein
MPTFRPPEATPVELLGISTAEAQWLGAPAGERQRAEASAAGLAEGDSTDVITLSGPGVATAAALRAFATASDPVPGDVIGVLPDPIGAWSRHPAFGAPIAMVRLRGGGACTPERAAAATPATVPAPHRELPVAVADSSGGRAASIEISDVLVIATAHWAGVLWSNLLLLGPVLFGALVGPPWMLPIRGTCAFLRTFSTDPMVLAGAMTRIGRGAQVHPTAVVEGCTVGEGAKIGPGAVVRGSIVGAGASIEPQAMVNASVVGPRSHVQRQALVLYSVIHPDAAAGGAIQLSVLGPGSTLKHGAKLMDHGFGAGVRVDVAGVRQAVPLDVIGVGLGARTVVGSGVQIAPGRAVPPDLQIGPAADSVLRRIPRDLTGIVEVRDGTLVKR